MQTGSLLDSGVNVDRRIIDPVVSNMSVFYLYDCHRRQLLLVEVIEAAKRSCKAKADYNRAAEAKQDIGPSVQAFGEARIAERVVLAKLAQHRKEHGC